ncbi:MAG: hypothetical protein JSC189_000783 [Candidatus Tokpelaia sp. JSC189]|nr:MAG: hypothetical protein JSC189_000783 [Candidatus Tokpelaia sp. JSC189]
MKNNNSNLPFWQTKILAEMTAAEWENLCDGCGQCCMHKLEDEESGNFYETSVSCTMLDKRTCRCRDYDNRILRVSDCIQLTSAVIKTMPWLPKPALTVFSLKEEICCGGTIWFQAVMKQFIRLASP